LDSPRYRARVWTVAPRWDPYSKNLAAMTTPAAELSPATAYITANTIMSIEDLGVRPSEKDTASGRNPEKYYFTYFSDEPSGTPAKTFGRFGVEAIV